jgi:hypothetical protein
VVQTGLFRIAEQNIDDSAKKRCQRVRVEFGGVVATVAEVLLETLILRDVKRVYGLPGFAQWIHEFYQRT